MSYYGRWICKPLATYQQRDEQNGKKLQAKILVGSTKRKGISDSHPRDVLEMGWIP
jgi:hypothetical protein